MTCTLPKLKISFSPPLTNVYTGVDTVTIKGSLKGCSNPGGNVNVTSGKIVSGTFSSSGGCVGLINGTRSPVTLTISWKGKSLAGGKATIGNSVVSVNGAAPSYSGGNVGFELPNPTSLTKGSVTGSFAGLVMHESFAYTTTPAGTVAVDCSSTVKPNGKVKAAKGVKKLSAKTGTIIIP